ncbi:hypothetical protein DRQ53_12225 [bacterium]|nr:MAG: hypothetical protein DRQ53_12225 [bacterium]
MPLLTAFFDDSGSHLESERFVIAGNIASNEAWGRFCEAWNSQMTAWNLRWFHMKDAECEPGRNAFAGWRRDARHAAIHRFAKLVSDHRAAAVAVTYDHQAWRDTIARLPDCYPGMVSKRNPYADAFTLTLSLVRQLCDASGVAPGDVALVFATQTGSHGAARRAYKAVSHLMSFPEPEFQEIRQQPELQAADMMAWYVNRRRTRPQEPRRPRHEPLRRLPIAETFFDQTMLRHVADQESSFLKAMMHANESGEDLSDSGLELLRRYLGALTGEDPTCGMPSGFRPTPPVPEQPDL